MTRMKTKKKLWINPVAIRKAKIVYNFDLSECNRDNLYLNTTSQLISYNRSVRSHHIKIYSRAPNNDSETFPPL